MVKLRKKKLPDFVQWTEDTVRLPIGLAAEPGPIVLPSYIREIAQSMVDPTVERLSIIKAARVGYTTLISSLIGWHMTVDPAAMLVVVPAELDARNFVIATEDIFECSPALQGRLPTPASAGRSSRNTLLFRRGDNGASLRLVGATAPRNLRAVGAKILISDEADGLKPTAEGDAITLAERRTLSYPDRRLIVGSTPLDAETSHVCRLYRESDQRIFEVPCASCGALSSIEWEALEWPSGHPEAAMWRCPHCHDLIPETHKAAMVERGAWRPRCPDVSRHRGYIVPATLSALANVTWGKLAAEFESVKDDPGRLKVFYCTSLARPWEEQGETVDGSALSARAEPFSLDALPPEVILLTCGIDCQDDRLEVVICGWSRTGECYVLAYETIFGAIDDHLLWAQVSDLLAMTWTHPAGGSLRIDSMCIDAGDGGHMEIVLQFCTPRSGRRIRAIKGLAGFARKLIEPSKSKMHGGGRLWLCGEEPDLRPLGPRESNPLLQHIAARVLRAPILRENRHAHRRRETNQTLRKDPRRRRSRARCTRLRDLCARRTALEPGDNRASRKPPRDHGADTTKHATGAAGRAAGRARAAGTSTGAAATTRFCRDADHRNATAEAGQRAVKRNGTSSIPELVTTPPMGFWRRPPRGLGWRRWSRIKMVE